MGARRHVGGFSGKVVNKIDAKGRVSVPARFRQLLIEQGNQSVLMIRSANDPAIEAFGEVLVDKLAARLETLDPMTRDYDELSRRWFARRADVAWDAEGRIRIPDDLRDYAKLGNEIAFVGLNHKFQIWNPDDYETLYPAPAFQAEGRS